MCLPLPCSSRSGTFSGQVYSHSEATCRGENTFGQNVQGQSKEASGSSQPSTSSGQVYSYSNATCQRDLNIKDAHSLCLPLICATTAFAMLMPWCLPKST